LLFDEGGSMSLLVSFDVVGRRRSPATTAEFHLGRVDESPLPVDHLVGTVRVRDEGEPACVVEREATFEPAGIPEGEAVELVSGIFQAGLDAL
jgi:hypothetical protein